MARGYKNPCYFLLVVVGVAFAVTACAYFVMALHGDRAARAGEVQVAVGLLGYLQRNGNWILGIELALLALLTCGAIATDDYWTRREQAAAREHESA